MSECSDSSWGHVPQHQCFETGPVQSSILALLHLHRGRRQLVGPEMLTEKDKASSPNLLLHGNKLTEYCTGN